MADPTGRFVWYELMTTDPAGAKAFYGKVVGWEAQDSSMPGMEYTIFGSQGKMQAGLMTLPAEAQQMGAPPHWLGYVAVADVDAAAEAITANGGRIYVPPMDIPEIGRFAVGADPHGATFAVGKFAAAKDESQVSTMMDPGGIGWHELYAGDLEPAYAFYAKLFGWKKTDAMDMGEMGTYQMYGVGETTLGGMMTKPAEAPVPYWNYYFNVGNIDEAAARVTANGGTIIVGPMEVPGGGWIVTAFDPQGAVFSLYGKK